MIRTFFKAARNHLIHNKSYTTINIIGLAVGIGCAVVIYSIIRYESSFDTYQKHYANIYRLINRYKFPAKGVNYDEAQVNPLAQALRNDFPSVVAAMTYYAAKGRVSITDKNGYVEKFQENTGLAYVEPDIFKIFDFKFLAGDAATALSNPKSVVISTSLVQKYFKLPQRKVDEAIGRTITINNKGTFNITGIIADPPGNTDLPFKIIADYKDQSASNPYYGNGTDWNDYNSATNCYLLLPKGISSAAFQKQLSTFYFKYNTPNPSIEQNYILQPLSELHSGRCDNYNHRVIPVKELMSLGLIGLFLIIIAAFNFINLSTAQAAKRHKEIMTRKILGVRKSQLIVHFLGETMLISGITTIVGLLIAHFLLIHLQNIIGYRLHLNILKDPANLIFLIVLVVGTGILSGLYPSVLMAGMSPLGVKNNAPGAKKTGSLTLRSALIIIQFAISVILIISTLVMRSQVSYFISENLGFNKDHILISSLPDSSQNDLQVLKNDLLKIPGISNVCFGTRSLLADWDVNNPINYPTLEKNRYSGNLKAADEDYLNLYGLKLIAGHNLPTKKNTGEAVVNRKLTKLLGFKDPNDALGAKFKYGGRDQEFTIVGVVDDFHSQSLQYGMENVIFSNLSYNIDQLAVKFIPVTSNLAGTQQIIRKIKEEWNKIYPDNIFNYRFLDRQIAGMYKEEIHTTTLVQLFAIIAIILGCLGLFGLISHITDQKIKEIGIRKVNGAKTAEVMAMLNKDLTKWVAVAFVISCPIVWYAMNKWLENFAYRTSLSWWDFALAGSLALGIALLTVSFHAWKAATRNPVEALRYE